MKTFFTFSACTTLLASLVAQNPAALDPSFASQGKLVLPQSRTGDLVAAFPDESLLLVGNPMSNGSSRIVKLKPDGSTDPTFGNAGTYNLQIMEKATRISELLIAPEAIYLCGSTSTDVGGTTTFGFVAALLPDGSALKSDFGNQGILKFQSPKVWYMRALIKDNQGNLYAGGTKTIGTVVLAKINPQGQLIPSFGSGGLLELNPGITGHWFDGNDASLDWHPDGDLLFAFKYMRATSGSNDPNFARLALAKCNPNGQLNTAFGNAGLAYYNYDSTSLDLVTRVHARPDGRMLLSAMTWTGLDYDYLAIGILSNGNLDPNFGQQGIIKWDLNGKQTTEGCYNSLLLPDGRLLLTGNHGSGDTVYFALAMLDPNGQPDQSFHPDGFFKHIFNENNNSSSSGAVRTPQGKIVLTGYTRTCSNGVCGVLYWSAAKYNIPEINSTGINSSHSQNYDPYPNPIEQGNLLHFPFPGHWQIQDVQGKIVANSTPGATQMPLPSDVNSGTYFLKEFNHKETFRLVVNAK